MIDTWIVLEQTVLSIAIDHRMADHVRKRQGRWGSGMMPQEPAGQEVSLKIAKPPSRHHVIAAARCAAMEARRRQREPAVPRNTPDVFVVRLSGEVLQFGWEIRRFGPIVLDRSRAEYLTTRDAYAAGREALSARSPDV